MTEKVKRYLIVEVDVIGNTNLCESCPLVNRKEMCCQYRINKDMKKGCPLKPMPKKRIYSDELADEKGNDMYMEGWNACIDEITGETE